MSSTPPIHDLGENPPCPYCATPMNRKIPATRINKPGPLNQRICPNCNSLGPILSPDGAEDEWFLLPPETRDPAAALYRFEAAVKLEHPEIDRYRAEVWKVFRKLRRDIQSSLRLSQGPTYQDGYRQGSEDGHRVGHRLSEMTISRLTEEIKNLREHRIKINDPRNSLWLVLDGIQVNWLGVQLSGRVAIEVPTVPYGRTIAALLQAPGYSLISGSPPNGATVIPLK